MEEIRTMAVEYDAHGERFRSWRDVAAGQVLEYNTRAGGENRSRAYIHASEMLCVCLADGFCICMRRVVDCFRSNYTHMYEVVVS